MIHPKPASLGQIVDTVSKKSCLLDTGSQVSLWPCRPNPVLSTMQMKLVAANGTPIKTYGFSSRQIKLGEKIYIYAFFNANIPRPILGMDFLQHFGMVMDLKAGKFIHSGIQTPFSGASSSVRGGVNLVHDAV